MTPFVLVYDALWELAEASSPLAEIVKPSNRIKFNHTGTKDPIKREVSQADLPEIILVTTGTAGNIQETSSTSRINKQFEWIVATGDLSVVNRLLPIEWAIWCAMIDYKAVLGALTWESQHFVKRCALLNASSGFTDSERNRGIRGWSSVWSIEVEMHFRTSNLSDYNLPAPTTT